MCGIAGFWRAEGLPGGAREFLHAMTGAIAHRGPDGDGHWLDAEAGIALGHRRLAILDLSEAGAQPMASASGRYVATYNGEIYNWRELRAEEERFGAQWRGHSDTEVMLTMCDRLGIAAAIARCAGMFAIAIWDRRERTLTLARDRIGEKPLYYGYAAGTLVFGSELKALRSHPDWSGTIDRNALALYLRHNYVPGPHSIYDNVRKLPPATIVTFAAGADRWPEPVSYWSLRAVADRGRAEPLTDSAETIATDLEALLARVIGQEMVADVPLGAFLSGGIDSSLVVALMQRQSSVPVRTFTIGFGEAEFNEAGHARAVATHLGTAHTELYVTPQDALDVVPRLPAMFDEPFGDVSEIPTYLVAAMARRDVTVALSGDGGDESFGGYGRYFLTPRIWSALRPLPLPLRRFAAGVVRAIPPRRWDQALAFAPAARRQQLTGDRVHKLAGLFAARSPAEIYRHLHSHWQDPSAVVIDSVEPRTLLSDAMGNPLLADHTASMMLSDSVSYLPDDILVKVDRAAMATSLEARAPLLHHEVIEFAWRIPPGQRVAAGVGKLPLRRILDRHVPRALIDRPKTGFGVPLDRWLRGELRPWAAELLDPARLRREGFLNPVPVATAWEEHQSGTRNWQYHLWDVLMFQAWLETNPVRG